MDLLEFAVLILVVVILFLSPFVMSKILSWLRKKFESRTVNDLKDTEEQNYKLTKENIRYFATFFVFIGMVGLVTVLLNNFGDRKLIYFIMALILLISALGVWNRQIWAIWIIMLYILAFAVYTLRFDLESIFRSITLLLILYKTFTIYKSIHELRRLELGESRKLVE